MPWRIAYNHKLSIIFLTDSTCDLIKINGLVQDNLHVRRWKCTQFSLVEKKQQYIYLTSSWSWKKWPFKSIQGGTNRNDRALCDGAVLCISFKLRTSTFVQRGQNKLKSAVPYMYLTRDILVKISSNGLQKYQSVTDWLLLHVLLDMHQL